MFGITAVSGSTPTIVPLTSLTFQASASGTSSVVVPSVQNGDLGILLVFSETTTAPSTISSYTSVVVTPTSSAIKARVSYKLLTTSDSGSTISHGAISPLCMYLVFRPNTGSTITSVTPTIHTNVVSSATITSSLASVAEKPQIALIHYANSGNISTVTTTPTNTIEILNGLNSTSRSQGIRYRLFSSTDTSQDITVNHTDNGTNLLQNLTLSVA